MPLTRLTFFFLVEIMSNTFQFIPPSEEELVKVATNKQRLIDDQCTHPFTDVAVLRFIRGHKGNEEKAYHFKKKHVQWRADENADAIELSSIENVVKRKAALLFGRDKKGRPIVNVLARRHDAYNRDPAEVKRFIIYLLEATMRTVNPKEEQLTIVFDLHGFGMHCMDYEAVKMLIEILQFNYPDVLGQAFIVNAPFIFWACWHAIKVWVDPVTVSKVIFCDQNQLREHVDEESVLPSIGSDEGKEPESDHPVLLQASFVPVPATQQQQNSEPAEQSEPVAANSSA